MRVDGVPLHADSLGMCYPEIVGEWIGMAREGRVDRCDVDDALNDLPCVVGWCVSCDGQVVGIPKVGQVEAEFDRECETCIKRRYQATARWVNPDKAAEYQREYQKKNPHAGRRVQHMRDAVKRGAGKIEPIERAVVFHRDGGRCQIASHCGGAPLPERGWHLDHIVPLSRGGDHTYANVQAACATCNMRKSNRVQS